MVSMISELDNEAALAVNENSLGWVAPVAKMIRIASSDNDIKIENAKAAAIEVQFSRTVPLKRYERLAEALLKT
jgi:hypothetical protein